MPAPARKNAAAAQAPLDAETQAALESILPSIDESDPEWQAYVREKIREALDDPRPDLSAEEVAESLRAHHEAWLKRGA